MSELLRNSLQLFCRICLGPLRQGEESIYDIHLIHDLTKIFIICTTMDINEDSDLYPKCLCQQCYDKLQDFQSFRSMALVSAEVLSKIINCQEIDFINSCKEPIAESNEIKYESNEDEDDDQLLVPQLSSASFCAISTNTESSDFNDKSPEILRDFSDNEVEIKMEIEFGSEELISINENDEIFRLSEPTEDDCQNEREQNANGKEKVEIALSSNSISNISASARKPKQDRRKKALKCHLCNKQVYKQVYLNAHIRTVHEGHEKPFQCNHCNKSYTRYNQLHLHIHSTHSKEKFPCEHEGCDAIYELLTAAPGTH